MAALHSPGTLEAVNPEPDLQLYMAVPGLELARAKSLQDILTSVSCFAEYTVVICDIGKF